MDDKLFSAVLTKELCKVCAKEVDGAIIINTRLTKSNSKKVDELNGKVIGWAKDLCPECQKMHELGFIFIGVDEKKTDDVTNPYRTGNTWCLKQEAAINFFKPDEPPKSGIAFIDWRVAQQIGLPDVVTNA